MTAKSKQVCMLPLTRHLTEKIILPWPVVAVPAAALLLHLRDRGVQVAFLLGRLALALRESLLTSRLNPTDEDSKPPQHWGSLQVDEQAS